MRTIRYSVLMTLLVLGMVAAGCGAPAATPTPAAPAAAPTKAAAAAAPTTAAPAAAPTKAAAPTTAPTTAAGAAAATAPAATKGTAGGAYGELKTIDVEPNASITFAGWGDETEQKIYRDSITRFNQFYPNVKVNYTPIPADFQTKLKAQMAGGSAPDVFYVDYQLMTAFGASNQLLTLDDYMTQAGENRDAFIPQLLTIFTLNNKIYALPKDWGTLGLVYLPQAFKDANIAEPTDKWTWDDVKKAADAIAKAGKVKGYCMGPDSARFGPFVFQNGGNFTSADYKTATLNTPEVKGALDFVAGLKQSGSLVQASDVSASWCGEAIGKQLVGMTYEGGWMVNFMKQTYPNVQWKAVPLPAGPKGQADEIFTNGIGINAGTKFPKASAAFAIFLTSRFNQGEIVKTGFAYSTHPDQANLIVDPNDKAIAAGGGWANSKVEYWGPYTGALETAIGKGLQALWLGATDVAGAQQQMQQDATNALAGK